MKYTVHLIDYDDEYSDMLAKTLITIKSLNFIVWSKSVESAIIDLEKITCDLYIINADYFDASLKKIIAERKKINNQMKLIILSKINTEKVIMDIMTYGVNAFIIRSKIPENLADIIIATINGEYYIDANASSSIVNIIQNVFINNHTAGIEKNNKKWPRSNMDSNKIDRIITKKEMDILNSIAQGLPAKKIAYNYSISVHTVNQHTRSLYKKLNVNNKIEALRAASSMGIIEIQNNMNG